MLKVKCCEYVLKIEPGFCSLFLKHSSWKNLYFIRHENETTHSVFLKTILRKFRFNEVGSNSFCHRFFNDIFHMNFC